MSQKPYRYSLSNGIFWLALFFLLSILPIAIAYSGTIPPKRLFLEELGVSLGFIGLALFGLQFIFSGRIKQIVPVFGTDNVVQFHKEIGIVAIVLTLCHPIMLLWSDWDYAAFYDPRENLPRASALVFATFGMLTLLYTSLWRVSSGLNYEWWRLLHGILGFGLVFVGVVHSIQVGHYLNSPLKVGLLILFFLPMVYFVFHTRIIRPWISRKNPFVIREVVPKKDDCYTLKLENNGSKKFSFEPGQFTWITIADTSFSMQQHPFSFSSSAASGLLEITAKRLGDFTKTWKYLKPGQTAFLEGPFGSFTLKDKPCFMVMGGIGVTPAISILKTLYDRKDDRKCILIYGNENWKKIPFRDELATLEKKLNLQLIHVLEEPNEGWEGEKGLISEELIRKYLPENCNEFDYYICGPAPMMDEAELTFRDSGVDWKNIYAERFDFV
ncbi:ferredoxin reductase family protein [Mongoliibacter ruber]|uniref:Putative ferric reductase n=1 Tax=Mongoliibacter ruber TaxID=1750599 RepID=A0A2T0WP77_9BACT|nr:ferric reductase-like transmembrane domain-containing protein [Mongoliibacter ruber]PRY88503.1 putative ferric reductase [Mongoliibacter ruber]